MKTTLSVKQSQLRGLQNAFVQSVSVQPRGNNVQVILHLANETKFYSGTIDHKSSTPTLKLHFANTDQTPLSGTINSLQQSNVERLVLPNGRVVLPVSNSNDTVQWKDLSLSLFVTSLPPATAGPTPYAAIIGNHANIISHESVLTPAGKATLVHFQRTSPAAAQSSSVQDEYDVIFFGNQFAYVLNALVRGNPSHAKNEVIKILSDWAIPTD